MDSEVYNSCWNCGNHDGAWSNNPCELSEEEDKNKEPKNCPYWIPKNY